MFAVDTRLRSNGPAMARWCRPSALTKPTSQDAEAWEGIAYMKSRAVAGDVERATDSCTSAGGGLERYGQSGRSRKTTGGDARRWRRSRAPESAKAGVGAYYDIDFALIVPAPEGAGIFYKVLNTPARIE